LEQVVQELVPELKVLVEAILFFQQLHPQAAVAVD
jgi:hypothetical protein